MWVPLPDNYHSVGVVLYPFNGSEKVPAPYGLDLALGDVINLIGEYKDGWLVGNKTQTDKLCVIPSNYIHRTRLNPDTLEITTVLREWGEQWKKLYKDGHEFEYQLQVIGRGIRELIEGRRVLLNGSLTKEQNEELKLKLSQRIDWGNRRLGLDLVPRDGYKIIGGGENTGVVQLYRYHTKSVETGEAARTTLKRRKSKAVHGASGGHHLLMNVSDYNFSVGEDCEMYFSVYDAGRGAFMSERYVTSLPSSNSTFIDKMQTISTLFIDLCSMDLTCDLYIVTNIVRLGRMFQSDNQSKKSTQNYRRPVACGVLNLNATLLNQSSSGHHSSSHGPENEHNFKLYNCDEKDYWQIHDLIIKGSSKVTATNWTVTLTLKLFTGDLKAIREENLVLNKNIVFTKKMGFPDVIMPGVVRNDLYVTILHGEFEKGGKTMGGKNISVTVLAQDSNGNNIENGVFSAANLPNYESIVLYHNNNPKWNETIRINIPIERCPDIHLRIEYRHCSTKEKNERKLFGFSFIKLMDSEGTFIKDTVHNLPIYKCDDSSKLQPSNYLYMDSAHRNVDFQKSAKESMSISTHLVSTKLTQNMDLFWLLRWKCNPEKVKETLVNMAKLPGEELVKFLQDVLDVIFAMFIGEDGCSTVYSSDAFVVLINIFTLLEDSKFEHFKPVIDAYIQNHFAAALVYKGLIISVKHYAQALRTNTTEKEDMKQVQKCFKTFHYIFKFIAQSIILFEKATGGYMEDSLRGDVNDMFSALNNVLSIENNSDELVNSQSILLLNFSKIYNNLQTVLPVNDLSQLILGAFKKIPLYQSAHRLSPSKLTAFCHLVESELFKKKETRTILLPEICRHIRHHLSIRDELKITSDILLAILDSLYCDPERNHGDIEIIATNILEPLINAVIILERTSTIITPLVVTLIALYQQMTEYIYNRIFDEFKDLAQIRSFILRSLYVFRDLIKVNVFNSDWFKMKILVNSIILRSIQNYSNIITSYFLKPNYDSDLFLEYFNICFSFILQDCLQLELFRDGKVKWVLKEYKDMRVSMCKEILNIWNCIDEKIQFVPGLIGQILLGSLVPQGQLAEFLLPLIIDLIDEQYQHFGDFQVVEAELFDKLDTYIMDNKGNENYIKAFHTIATRKLENLKPKWISSGKECIASVKSLLEILLDYRIIPNDVENKEKKMNCINNLLTFYKNVNLKQLYLKYIYKLHDLHVSSENYTEAGFTLLLHSELLDFQHDYDVKESLHQQVIKYFDQGKLWESGIPLCKELAKIYEAKFDYIKLSSILTTTSTNFNNILTQHRPEPEYFRVSFIGQGFPLFVRNKEFIYRGFDYERLTSFVQRIIAEWSEAELLKNINTDSNLANSEGKYLQIRSVKPLPSYPKTFESAPCRIRSYYNTNNICKFQYDHSLSKNMDDVSSIYIERTILETSNSFPGILRCFLVISKVTTVLTPIKFAVEKMIEVNKNLEDVVTSFSEQNGGVVNVNPLSMRLQGILDANVQGGLPKYQEAFFTTEYLTSNPDSIEDVNNLKKEILNQVDILDRALTLHGNIIPPGVQPLHNRLIECFNTMKANFDGVPIPPVLQRSDSLRVCSSIVNTPLPPLPVGNGFVTQVNRLTGQSLISGHGYGIVGGGSQIGNLSDDEEVYSIPANPPPPVPSRKKKPIYIEPQLQQHQQSPQSNNISTPSSISPPPTPPRLRPISQQQSTNTNTSLREKSSTPVPYENKDENMKVDDNCGEYIIMPPSRLRELSATNNITSSPLSVSPQPQLQFQLQPKSKSNEVMNGELNGQGQNGQHGHNGVKTPPPPVPPKPGSQRDSTDASSTTPGDRRSCNSNNSSGGGSTHKEYYVPPGKRI